MITQLHTPDGIIEVDIPDPDAERAAKILANSPDVITMPEVWEMLRIIGRRLNFIPPA